MSLPHLDRPNNLGAVHFMKRPHRNLADVVDDPIMTTTEKRAMLADWASDRRAVLDHPALRRLDTGKVVDIDAVLDALKRLDEVGGHGEIFTARRGPKREHQASGRHANWVFWRKDDDDDDPPPCPAAAKPWKPRPVLDAAAGLMAA